MNETNRNDEQHSLGHEPDLVNVPRVLWTSVGLALIVTLGMWLIYGLLQTLNREMPIAEPASLVQLAPPGISGPHLNPDQALELQSLREQQDAMLHRYGWVDRQKGIARIPIDRAMEILAAEGLPAHSSKGPPTDDK